MNFWLVVGLETLAISVIGSLLHFTYDWSGKNKFVAIFSAVNESTWEHIKLALSGSFCCMLVDIWFLGANPNYWIARSVAFVVPIIIIPVIFYTYTTWTKKPVLPVDISSFIIAAFISSLVFAGILELRPIGEMGGVVSMIISIIVLAAYLLLTKFPLHMFLFRDPITGQYGYDGHSRNSRSRRKTATRNSRKR